MSFFILLVLLLPDDVFGLLAVYSSKTPNSIDYKWLDYRYGIIYFVISIIGIILVLRRWQIGLFLVVFVILLREVLIAITGNASLFFEGAYEMYLSMFVGYSLLIMAVFFLKDQLNLEWLFGLFLISNMLTIFLQYVLGRGGNEDGRYYCTNLDVGGSGVLCVLCILYLFFISRKTIINYIFVYLSFVGLWLTGSRSNLAFLLLIFTIYYAGNIATGRWKRIGDKRFVVILIPVLLIIILLCINSSFVENNRMVTTLSGESFEDDSSVLGRTASILAGFDIIQKHWWGISGFFVNLQREMTVRDFPTFPHSTFVALYILFGPIILALYYYWLILLWKMKNKLNNGYFWIIVYLIVSTIVYGGPIVNFKIYFEMMLATYLAARSTKIQQILRIWCHKHIVTIKDE